MENNSLSYTRSNNNTKEGRSMKTINYIRARCIYAIILVGIVALICYAAAKQGAVL